MVAGKKLRRQFKRHSAQQEIASNAPKIPTSYHAWLHNQDRHACVQLKGRLHTRNW